MEGQVEVKYRCRRCRATQTVLVRESNNIKKSKNCPYCATGRMRVEPKANRVKKEK